MYDAADSILAQKISQVEGVGQVFVGGGAKPAVRVEVNPGQLSALGIGLEDVRGALGDGQRQFSKVSCPDGQHSARSTPTTNSSTPTIPPR